MKMEISIVLVLVILALHDNFGNAMCPNSSGNFTFTVEECGNDVISCIRDKTANLTRGDCVNVFLEGGNYNVIGNLTVGLSLRPSTSSLVSLTCTEAGEERNDSFLSVENSSYLELFRISFSSCSRAVEANNVETVIIDSSSFKNMNGSGALNIYNCLNVTVVDTIFTDCINQGRFLEPYRGNSGALSIGFEMESKQAKSYIIENCTFNASFALANYTRQSSSTELALKNIFNGRGGGLALIFNATSSITVQVIGSTFYGNKAAFAGGAIMVFLEEDIGNSDILIEGNFFLENCADRGGGIAFALFSGSSLGPNTLNVTSNVFESNKATRAAGLFVIPAYNGMNNVTISLDNSSFRNNEGLSTVVFSSLRSFLLTGIRTTQPFGGHSPPTLRPVMENMRFENNTAESGVVVAINYPLLLKGKNIFTKNQGSSLRIVSTVVRLEGYLGFFDNVVSGGRGSAMLFSNGQIELTRDSEIAMEGNIGSIGAAIFSEPVLAQSQFLQTIGNPSCFFVYEEDDNRILGVQDWKASVIISSNRAQVGSAIYADQIEQCSYYIDESPFFDVTCFFDGNVCNTSISSPFTFSDNTNSRQSESTRHHHLSIATPPAKFKIACSNLSLTSNCNETQISNVLKVEAFPGETIAIALSVLDDLNFPTYGVISLEIADGSKARINETVFSIYPDEPNYFFSYTFQSDEDVQDTLIIIGSLSSIITFDVMEYFSINISRKHCPVGQILINGTCECSLDEGVVQCDSKASRLLLEPNLWALEVRENDEHGRLFTTFCPPGYCRCNMSSTSLSRAHGQCNSIVNLNDPDSQCNCRRHGYLCGSCNEGYSVSALFLHCQDCNDGYGALIAVLILIDSIVIVIIQTLPIYMEKLKMNSFLYSAIFFFQIAPYAASGYPILYGDFHKILRYFGSLLGLYFPYDVCLYNNATALEAFGIRYVPFILALIITPTVIGIMWLLKTRQKITYEGVWIVWMLILNDIFATSFGVLNCTSLPDQNNQARLVWFYDGTVECFSGAHAALAVWAILVLLLCILATGFLLLVMYRPKKLKFRRIIRKMAEPVKNGFLDEYQYWFVIDIARRFLLIACLVFETDKENAAMFVLSVYFWMYAYFKPYKLATSNIFELLLLFNFWIMETLRSVSFLNDTINDTHSNSVEPSDCDGINVNRANILIVPFIIIYYLPVLYLFLPITVAIVRKCSSKANTNVKNYRNKKRQEPKSADKSMLPKNVTHTTVETGFYSLVGSPHGISTLQDTISSSEKTTSSI